MKSALAQRGLTTGYVVDLGCGSGILSEAVSKSGHDVVGIDLSPAMLRIARRRAPNAVFRRGSLLSAPLPKSVGIAAVGECINYLFDGNGDDNSLARLFQRIHRALEPGGIFLFDVAEPGRLAGLTNHKAHWEGKDWAILVTAEEDRKRNLLVRRITTFRKVGRTYRRDEEVHRLRLFPAARIVRFLKSAGFDVRTLRGYSKFRFPPGVVGYQCVAQPLQRARRSNRAQSSSRMAPRVSSKR